MNTVSLVIQLFISSRVVKYLGLRWGLLLLPIYSLGAYGLIAMVPTLAVVRWSKTCEKATDSSLHNTLRAMLFLPTTREQKKSQAGNRLLQPACRRRAGRGGACSLTLTSD